MTDPDFSRGTPSPYLSPVSMGSCSHDAGIEDDEEPPESPQGQLGNTLLLERFLTVNASDSSLRHEALISIRGGWVRENENMLCRWQREQQQAAAADAEAENSGMEIDQEAGEEFLQEDEVGL